MFAVILSPRQHLWIDLKKLLIACTLYSYIENKRSEIQLCLLKLFAEKNLALVKMSIENVVLDKVVLSFETFLGVSMKMSMFKFQTETILPEKVLGDNTVIVQYI